MKTWTGVVVKTRLDHSVVTQRAFATFLRQRSNLVGAVLASRNGTVEKTLIIFRLSSGVERGGSCG